MQRIETGWKLLDQLLRSPLPLGGICSAYFGSLLSIFGSSAFHAKLVALFVLLLMKSALLYPAYTVVKTVETI